MIYDNDIRLCLRAPRTDRHGSRLWSRHGFIVLLVLGAVARLAAEPFAIGLISGDPIGILAQYRFNDRLTIRAALGWDLSSPGGPVGRADILIDPIAGGLGGIVDFRLGLGVRESFLVGDGRYSTASENYGTTCYLPLILAKRMEFLPIELYLEALAGLRVYPNFGFESGIALGALWSPR